MSITAMDYKDKRDTIPMMGRIKPDLAERVERIMKLYSFNTRSRFVEQAIREYVIKCETEMSQLPNAN